MGKSQFCLILFFLVMAWAALAAEPDLIPFVAVAPDHWSFELRGGLSDTHSGKRALHVVIDPGIQTGQDYSEVSQRVDGIAAGPKLAASVWVRGFDPDVRLVLVFRDRDGKELSDTSSPLAPAEQVWKLLKAEAVAPPGSYALNVSLQARAPGYVTFDDVSLLGAGLSNGGFENGWSAWVEGDKDENVGTIWISDTNFVPWGLNYDRTIVNGKDLVVEEAPLEKIDRDFRTAHQQGANAVRLFTEISRYMPRYMEMNESALKFLDEMILLARKHNLRIDLTGLTQINVADFPSWYDQHSDAEIMAAEALFWGTLAKRYAHEPAFLMFDLQNEPFTAKPDTSRKTIGCFTMSEGRQFCYCNPHFRDAHTESPDSMAHAWTKTMVDSIRQFDHQRLITIGLLPTAAPVFEPGNPGFNVAAVADLLDIVSIHVYPDRKVPEQEKADYITVNRDWLEMTLRYANNFGKPVIVEEWGPLGFDKDLPSKWFSAFMDASRHNASGWFTFYHALLVDGATEIPEQVRQFRDHHREIQSSALGRAPADVTLQIDAQSLWHSQDKINEVLQRYRQLRESGKNVDFSNPGP